MVMWIRVISIFELRVVSLILMPCPGTGGDVAIEFEDVVAHNAHL
jgi:hypothetical protein